VKYNASINCREIALTETSFYISVTSDVLMVIGCVLEQFQLQ